MDLPSAFLLSVLVMIVGLIGTIVPGIPGVPLVWAGLVLFGILDQFHHLPLLTFVLLNLVAAVGTFAGVWGTQLWAKKSGASGCSAFLGSCLLVLGLLLFTLPVALLLAVAGVFSVEWRRRSSARLAAVSSSAWLIGWAMSTVVEFVTACIVIFFFVQAVFS